MDTRQHLHVDHRGIHRAVCDSYGHDQGGLFLSIRFSEAKSQITFHRANIPNDLPMADLHGLRVLMVWFQPI